MKSTLSKVVVGGVVGATVGWAFLVFPGTIVLGAVIGGIVAARSKSK